MFEYELCRAEATFCAAASEACAAASGGDVLKRMFEFDLAQDNAALLRAGRRCAATVAACYHPGNSHFARQPCPNSSCSTSRMA
ncbi:hypothetical protein ACFOLG_00750 [Vogesella facilis]|uniref:Uncharacterized protein n=1 Tax=Vogesella facilis TaxID=1655232 RepID=A0ABV7R912_9NEIS